MSFVRSLRLSRQNIKDEQATSWFEYASNFEEPLTLQFSRQMMHHQTTENDIERVVRKCELLYETNLEVDGKVAPRCFAASDGNHLWRSIYTVHHSSFANAL